MAMASRMAVSPGISNSSILFGGGACGRLNYKSFTPRLDRKYSCVRRNNGIKHVVALCNRNSPPAGDRDSKDVLDAFFVGKALAEALNEQIGTAIGEFLSEIGRLQAEQQKRTRDFQEEVLERAQMIRDKAAREALGKEPVKETLRPSYSTSTSATDDSVSVSNSPSKPLEPNSSVSNDSST
eukprot:TRINITY_DN2129_c0_g1_i1.p1 TRINITY_DN2129_c0_g1~~TRINITY_DN2129_c0_g1_i1.p1  ORF type:complete len:182 (+),score=34.93 TRINITY_DN2129_c0_g1_i1:180-725(+)